MLPGGGLKRCVKSRDRHGQISRAMLQGLKCAKWSAKLAACPEVLKRQGE